MKTYLILTAGKWERVKGRVLPHGWLEWKSTDGTTGLSRPGKWQSLPEKPKA